MSGARRKGFMVVATGQHAGKTTTCLGLVSGLIAQGKKVSFLKPVGQSWVEVDDYIPEPAEENDPVAAKRMKHVRHKVDKDCILFKEKFKLECPYNRMSPVLIPRGYTKHFIDGSPEACSTAEHLAKIKEDYNYLSTHSDIVVVEGTGHAGVGSIIDLDNATVARELGLRVVLVGTGGIGSAIDTLALSKAVCDQQGVEIAGVLLNKVQPGKEEIPDYVRRVVEDRWGVPFLGALPLNKMLSQPTMRDFEVLFKSQLVACEGEALMRIDDVVLIASSVEKFMHHLSKPYQLYVTPSSRTDILFALIADLKTGGHAGKCGLILTGEYPPHASKVISRLQQECIPTLILPNTTSVEVVSRIAQHTAKIRFEDTQKIDRAIEVVTNGVNFPLLMESATRA